MPPTKSFLAMAAKKKGSLLLGIILTMSAVAIVRALRAPTDTVARPADVEKAKRIEVDPTGANPPAQVSLKVDDPALHGVAANGEIEPLGDEILLASEVPGVLASVEVKEGQTVKVGDVLVTFRAQLERAQQGAAEADLKAARARAELARKSRDRTQRLSRDKAATQEEVDRADSTLALETAQVSAAEARVEQTKAALERMTVRAPADGEILKIHFKVGEYYNPVSGNPLLVMGDILQLRVRVELDERDLARIKVGTSGFFVADAFGDRKFSFTVTDLGRRMGRKELQSDDPRERNDTRVLDIYGKVEGSGQKELIPGLRVTVFMQPESPAGEPN